MPNKQMNVENCFSFQSFSSIGDTPTIPILPQSFPTTNYFLFWQREQLSFLKIPKLTHTYCAQPASGITAELTDRRLGWHLHSPSNILLRTKEQWEPLNKWWKTVPFCFFCEEALGFGFFNDQNRRKAKSIYEAIRIRWISPIGSIQDDLVKPMELHEETRQGEGLFQPCSKARFSTSFQLQAHKWELVGIIREDTKLIKDFSHGEWVHDG